MDSGTGGGMIAQALRDDIGAGDVTTDAIVPAATIARAEVIVKQRGVVCGLPELCECIRALDPGAVVTIEVPDGTAVSDPPVVAARVEGRARAILTAERTGLNVMQRMSGIASATRAYVEAVAGTGTEILDTRKTAPGLRALDRRAVACGGGVNHRSGLDAAVLIKDNHLAVAGGISAAVAAVRRVRPELPVEIEVESLDQLDEALSAGAETILLDNMALDSLRAAVARTAGRARLEASGGITLDTVRAVAESGVDAISVGALTHSVRALDISLEVAPWQP
jgi:nicotinate-nucleotide pyrophosphorylase (carboxylating)